MAGGQYFDAAMGTTGLAGRRKWEGIDGCRCKLKGENGEAERDAEISERRPCMLLGDSSEKRSGGVICFLGETT